MRPTIEDVAARAGVSRQTVSRVINGMDRVSPEARARVTAAIQELGYQRNDLAGSLRNGQTRTLGVLISDVLNPAFTAAVRGVQDTADAAGYQVILCNTDEKVENEERLIRTLRQKRVDGLLVIPCGTSSTRALELLARDAIPVVLLSRPLPGFDCVAHDAFDATEQALKHLVGLGHKRIAMVTARPRSAMGLARRRAYEETLARHGIEYRPELVRSAGADHRASREVVLELLGMEPRPTGLFVSSNPLTLGALLAIREVGLRMPDQISLVGYNMGQWATAYEPPLTTMEIESYSTGRIAADLLLRRIRGNDTDRPASIRLLATLKVRGSSGPAERVEIAKTSPS